MSRAKGGTTPPGGPCPAPRAGGPWWCWCRFPLFLHLGREAEEAEVDVGAEEVEGGEEPRETNNGTSSTNTNTNTTKTTRTKKKNSTTTTLIFKFDCHFHVSIFSISARPGSGMCFLRACRFRDCLGWSVLFVSVFECDSALYTAWYRIVQLHCQVTPLHAFGLARPVHQSSPVRAHHRLHLY